MPGKRPQRLHPIEASELHARRERVFLIIAGVFLGSMAMLNILGITKFIHFGPVELAVGVLPYPLTFLCTDFISELYGRKRANFVVFVGLIINLIVLGFIWAGDAAEPIDFRTPEQRIVTFEYEDVKDANDKPITDPATGYNLVRPVRPVLDKYGEQRVDADGKPMTEPITQLEMRPIPGVPGVPGGATRLVDAETGEPIVQEETLFGRIATTTRKAMLASMIAYLFAQFIDVWLFHYWKKRTKGRHLWLRNNGSTVVSQFVDTTLVVLITFWSSITGGEMSMGKVAALIGGAYAFKLIVALLDTIPLYIGVSYLSRYLQIDPSAEHEADAEELALDNPEPGT